MCGNALGDGSRYDSRNLIDAGRPQLRDATEAPQQLLRSTRTYTGNVFEARLNRTLCPALAMESYGKPVGFVANLLN
jgi:hypothetical protein